MGKKIPILFHYQNRKSILIALFIILGFILIFYIANSGLVFREGRSLGMSENGQIIKLPLTKTIAFEANIIQASLVQVIDTSQFSPPSSDPAGICYHSFSKGLLVSDSEVNKMQFFTGDNIFLVTLSGILSDTLTVMPFSDEPTGVTFNPVNGHIFISDDDRATIFEINPGSDKLHSIADDIIMSYYTGVFKSFDPEGLAYDTWRGDLFIVDGKNSEIYKVSPGVNGVFDSLSPDGDDQVTNFDTGSLGVTDPEGIAFDSGNGYLYVVGNPPNLMLHVTTEGRLVRLVDISATNALKPAGLCYAPGSINPSVMNVFITDRGVDNKNDGKIYEVSVPRISKTN